MVNYCGKLNLFGDQQNAYRSGRCTTDNLLTLTEKATTSFRWKGATAAAFLDVEQAFDSVWHEGILYKQIEIKTPWWITKWTSSFLSNRKIKVKYNQAISKSFTPEAGVPQGSITSPILFDMYVSKPKCKDTSVSQYADDIAIYYTHEKQEIATKHLQIGIKHLEKWCDKWKILLNAGKTIYTVFTRQILNTNLRLSLGSEDINVSKEVKFLGLDLNYKLTWTNHVEKIEIKRISKENTTRQQMKLIDKLNQAKKGNYYWKAAKILLNQNQKNNKQLTMNNQEAADAFAEKLKTTMKTNEPKTHNGKDHEKFVSLKIRETKFKAIKLGEDEWKHTEVKPSTLKSILGNRKNTAPGHDGISYPMMKQIPLETCM